MKLNIDKDKLEGSLNQPDNIEQPTNQPQAPQMTPEEEIGFHKGALNTLAAERNELVKMISNVEAIMQAHIQRLQELGVKIESKKE